MDQMHMLINMSIIMLFVEPRQDMDIRVVTNTTLMDKFQELFLMVIKEPFHSMAYMLQEPLPMDNMQTMPVNMPQEPITQLPSTQAM